MIALGFSIAGRGLLSNTYSSRVPVLNQVPLSLVLGVGLHPGYGFYQGKCFYLSRGRIGEQGGAPWGRHQAEFILFCKPTVSTEQAISKSLLTRHSGIFCSQVASEAGICYHQSGDEPRAQETSYPGSLS